MHPRQMRETVIPVLPSFEYCMFSPNDGCELRSCQRQIPAASPACQGRLETRSEPDVGECDEVSSAEESNLIPYVVCVGWLYPIGSFVPSNFVFWAGHIVTAGTMVRRKRDPQRA